MCVRWMLLSFAVVALSTGAAPVDYMREVKPLLAENCYGCHGASQQKHGLRLDTADLVRKGGENGPAIQAGQSRDSLIVRVVRGEHDSLSRMPYKKAPLSPAKIEIIARWIDEGAKAPPHEEPEKSVHWSFVPPARPEIPILPKSTRERLESPRARSGAALPKTNLRSGTEPNPIDAFIHARLARERIEPVSEADRITLLRRLSLDLVGLPPTPPEVDAFLNDRRLDAYERLVERLLASPHYGERWGRVWLDVARYADSNGYSIDAPRSIWKYRDWVIAALNRDMPFDEFTVWQIAGDLIDTNALPPGTGVLEPLIATGFHRNTQINQEGGIDPEQFRVESVMDRVNTTATAWLGVTLACAQCHDHKFDPFTQREYYQFYAFFNSTMEDGHGKGAPEGMLEIPGEDEGAEARMKELSETEVELDRYISTKVSEVVKWEQSLAAEARESLKPDVRKALDVALADRTIRQKRIIYAAFRPDDADFKQRNAKLTRLEKSSSKPVSTLVMRELPKGRDTHVFIKGDFTRPSQTVQPGVPTIIQAAFQGRPARSEKGEASGMMNRLDLARWLVDRRQPLTARVTVNRIWQHYFGRGLVETENDFGTQGSPPSHPDLLDWLACELMEPTIFGTSTANASTDPGRAWSLKH
ncbi:MAG TPA: PSD1 and planctomycete cytochrome C domain-containing protein, partial [Verrucomicrobiae bacterium]|nr:PSD1 and planctomycete cytochrome C domain-containing protein [Verrucomicrobiae bacterium]